LDQGKGKAMIDQMTPVGAGEARSRKPKTGQLLSKLPYLIVLVLATADRLSAIVR
jgi:hypothetical protein